jgi:hypothetical protein
MNIQLRDSKPLQDAIKLAANKNQLPKAQLHPELLWGIVDCDREGFDIRSECMFGDHRGESNPVDVRNLKHFLSEPRECEARWKIVTMKQGDSLTSIPSELTFTFDGPDEVKPKIVIHTQAVADITKLTSALPSDRSAKFLATPGEGKIKFTPVGAPLPQAPAPSQAIVGELQTQAAILGVPWDKAASLETMIERMNEKRAADAKAKAAPPQQGQQGKKQLQNA